MSEGRDLTELVQYLRTVHFVLLLACILTLLPTMVGRRGEVSEAYLQLQKIQAIRNSWDRWTMRVPERHLQYRSSERYNFGYLTNARIAQIQ